MGITAITRDWGDNVAIVRITTTDSLATVAAAGYITSQATNIFNANNGAFSWLVSDMTLVYASNGWAFASITPDFTSLTVLSSSVSTPSAARLVSFNTTVTAAGMASAASVPLIVASSGQQYKIKQLQSNSGGTNFSGGSGDRLAQITDGTTVYSVIPAASLQTLANAQWGVTALPNPASAAIDTSTAAGANLVMKYSGGTLDYTAGSVVISGLAERVA